MIVIRDPEVVDMEPYILSEEFKEGLAKVGPNSRFWYRSKLDPLTDPGDLKLLRTMVEIWLNFLKTTV